MRSSVRKTKSAKVYSLRSKIRTNRKRKASGFEKKIHAILAEEEIKFIKEKTVGRCHADIFIPPDVLIELNGCYWHGCPKCFPEPTKSQRLAMEKDARRYYFFKKLGFNLQIIWECELNDNEKKVRTKLRSLCSE